MNNYISNLCRAAALTGHQTRSAHIGETGLPLFYDNIVAAAGAVSNLDIAVRIAIYDNTNVVLLGGGRNPTEYKVADHGITPVYRVRIRPLLRSHAAEASQYGRILEGIHIDPSDKTAAVQSVGTKSSGRLTSVNCHLHDSSPERIPAEGCGLASPEIADLTDQRVGAQCQFGADGRLIDRHGRPQRFKIQRLLLHNQYGSCRRTLSRSRLAGECFARLCLRGLCLCRKCL